MADCENPHSFTVYDRIRAEWNQGRASKYKVRVSSAALLPHRRRAPLSIVMLQAMKEEPPLAAKCKDKFLIQSTLITPEKETLPLQDIVRCPSLPLL